MILPGAQLKENSGLISTAFGRKRRRKRGLRSQKTPEKPPLLIGLHSTYRPSPPKACRSLEKRTSGTILEAVGGLRKPFLLVFVNRETIQWLNRLTEITQTTEPNIYNFLKDNYNILINDDSTLLDSVSDAGVR